VYYLE